MKSEEIESIFQSIVHLNEKERAAVKQKNELSNQRMNRLYIWGVGVPLVLATTVGMTNKLTIQSDILNVAALLLLVLVYVGILALPFCEIISHRKDIIRFFKNPFKRMILNIKENTESDTQYISVFNEKSIDTLRFIKSQIELEKDTLMKKLGLILGAVEKVGLLPGILALLAMLSKLEAGQSEWVYALAYSIPFLHILGLALHSYIFQLNRVLLSLEHIIEIKENEDSEIF
ncbi:MAG: hypothetical protein ACRBBR_06595 [Cellvibrionaceae bacterium]